MARKREIFAEAQYGREAEGRLVEELEHVGERHHREHAGGEYSEHQQNSGLGCPGIIHCLPHVDFPQQSPVFLWTQLLGCIADGHVEMLLGVASSILTGPAILVERINDWEKERLSRSVDLKRHTG